MTTSTPTPTGTPIKSPTPTCTCESTDTPEPSETPLPTDTQTPTCTCEPTDTPEPSETPLPTDTPIPDPSSTPTPDPFVTPGPTLTPTPISESSSTPTRTPTPSPVEVGDVVINEFQYDPVQEGNDAAFEWLELLNKSGGTINLSGCSIEDNYGSDDIPALQLPPGGYVVIAATDDFYDNFPGYTGDIVFMGDGRIGNGLSNTGDRLYLIGPADDTIDAACYGDDVAVFDPSCTDVAAGHSLERQPAGYDTNQASDFVDNGVPTPGSGLGSPTPTDSPTEEPTNTPTEEPAATATPAESSQDSGGGNPSGSQSATPTATASPIAADIQDTSEFDVQHYSGNTTPGAAGQFSANLTATPTLSPIPTSTATTAGNETADPGGESINPWFYIAILIMAVTWMASHTFYFRHRTIS